VSVRGGVTGAEETELLRKVRGALRRPYDPTITEIALQPPPRPAP
jgi:hypothetical protein